ncbi:nestin [Hippoglossus hippoglossus]|uniref:nestin n=1 Tax=Hippoglossus hippoglossus TaxID=8267 RepID=UPI00148DDEB5|nr:nestin [Hippoglossus hippoglossus]
MEPHFARKPLHRSQMGDEKHQMLNLNGRLETYLSRVKHLEEENLMLAEEIGVLRHSNHGASTRRKGLEEELRRARQELDAAWRDRAHTEKEVGRLAEEFEFLELLRQREAQAHIKAKTMLEQSRKELDEEQRAKMWLREQVSQLEHEMSHLIQTHQEDVAHMEATLIRSRATRPPMAQRGNQTPNLLQLGQEYSQRATRAWQEAAEIHQGQLAQLEESLNQARGRLTRVAQEKSESQLRLQALEKEVDSHQDVRLHLETSAAQQRDKHNQEIQQLQAHLEDLEAEREDLGRQIERLLLENQGLLQMKMSLGLEVSTYRALLDSEILKGDKCRSNPSRDVSITDAAFRPRGVKKIYRTQQPASFSSLYVRTAPTATPLCSRKPTTFNGTQTIPRKPADVDAAKSETWETPYPKILQDGAVENFRPQEVQEKVTYAEPLSPPNEQEACVPLREEGGEGGEDVELVESTVSRQVESSLHSEPAFSDEVSLHQFTAPDFTPHGVRVTEKPSDVSAESEEGPAEEEDAPADALGRKECISEEVEDVPEVTSDSETEEVVEPTFESRTRSPASECEAAESVFNQLTDFSRHENSSDDEAAEITEEISRSVVGAKETDVEDKLLYPDGEEMDTWDSVIERKIDMKTDDGIKQDEAKRQHAEPEDISAGDPKHDKRGIIQGVTTDAQKDDNVAAPVTDTQVDDEHGPDPDNEEDDEEEDSQNVSVSWRTEQESDSYAQDNTLADTRPLIRYKSDETDANTQASHMDESESSEGDQEKRLGETGSGTWSEGKSKRYGTMEDLCEEVEGEVLDEEYDLGYSHIEHQTSVKDTERVEEMNKDVNEEYSDEESEEFPKPAAPVSVEYDEELETDRLVEQELESLSTDSFSSHFAQQQVGDSDEKLPTEAGNTKTDSESFCAESGATTSGQLAFPNTFLDYPDEKPYGQRKDEEGTTVPERREEEEEHNVSMVTHPDVSEHFMSFSDFINGPDVEQISNSDTQHVTTDVKPADPQEHLVEDVVDCPDVPETGEWEVLENPSEDPDIRAERRLHDDGGAGEGAETHEEEHLEIPPDSVPDESDIFEAKDSTELLKTNRKDNNLPGVFTSSVKTDFWASSSEVGATYQPDDACIEQTNQNLGFGENPVWGMSDNRNVINGNSLAAEKGQEQKSEVKQVLSRKVEVEFVHSEESEVEGESWSSGEEQE